LQRLTSVLAALSIHLLAIGTAWSVPGPQGGACPQPQHTLVANEFHLGAGLKPRWLEIINPGSAEVSLKNVVVRVTSKGIGGASANPDVIEFSIDAANPILPGGAVLVFGHVPGYDPKKGGLGFLLNDLGASFQLPLCDTKLQIMGPQGIVDTVTWDLCPPKGDPDPALWQTIRSLDPDHTDICLNDEAKNWCKATTDGLTKPSPGAANGACDLDGDGFTKDTGDCNDDDKTIGPLGFEFCNGVDDNCSGQTDEGVIALPGTCKSLGVCALPLGDGSPVAKCKGVDGWTCTYINNDKIKYESVKETICGDGYDNDCDGQTDEGLRNACGDCLDDDLTEVCDGEDNDCDGQTDEDVDLSAVKCTGIGVCVDAVAVCDPEKGPGCALPPAYEATEVSCDKKDNDCDGETDEDLGVGQACVVGTGECIGTGKMVCRDFNHTVGCNAIVSSPGSTDICGDGRDNDCDGKTDEGYEVGTQCSVGLGICRADGKKICNAAANGAICHATPGKPADKEVCDNKLDDDCDGATDESGCVQSGDGDGLTDCGVRPGRSATPLPLLLLIAGALLLVRSRRPA